MNRDPRTVPTHCLGEGFADPEARLGFGYAMNRTGAFMRQRALEEAVYASL